MFLTTAPRQRPCGVTGQQMMIQASVKPLTVSEYQLSFILQAIYLNAEA